MKKKLVRALIFCAIIGIWFTPYGGISVLLAMLWLCWVLACVLYNRLTESRPPTRNSNGSGQANGIKKPPLENTPELRRRAWNNYLIGDWTLEQMIEDLKSRGSEVVCINATDDDSAFQVLVRTGKREEWIK